MKKKQIALLLAALMCITPAAESVAVMGAEFSSGEEAASVEKQMEADGLNEAETVEDETESADVAGDNSELAEDEIWTSGEENTEFTADEIPETEEFISEESGTLTDAAEAKQVKGTFAVSYITEEQYNAALQNEKHPEVDMTTVENVTFSDALNSIKGENTGYCYVSVQDLEDAADFVVPEGMTVLLENARARSITPNGNIAFWGMVNPAKTVEIKEGKGTTAFLNLDMRSVLKGTGSDDKVIFCGQNNVIGGISGVENIYLRNNSHDLQVYGASEFFNIYNETDNIKNNPQDDSAFYIHVVNNKTAPVFHKTFDWGTGEFEGENGEKWSSPYGIGIIYNTSDEKNETWQDIPVPAGTQAVRYDMSDEDILEMLPRIRVHSEDGTTQDMNGKIWNANENSVIELWEFRNCEGMSAQENFEIYGKGEMPDEGCAWIAIVPGTAQAERYINAYQKKNNASGYYLMHMGAETEISGTLTVPGGVKALKIEGQNNYDESTDTDSFVPIPISSVNVPAGKKLALNRILVKANTLTFTGSGEVELINARLNANVTADKIKILAAVVKSLDCKELMAKEGGRLIVSEYLNFDKAEFHPDLVIYGQPGAYLKFGEISSEEFADGYNQDIFLGNDGKQEAKLYVGGALKLGKYKYEKEEYPRCLNVMRFNTKAAQAAGVPVAQDCFSPAYSYDGKEMEGNGWWEYVKAYQGEKTNLVTINSSLPEEDSIYKIRIQFGIIANGEEKRVVMMPRYLNMDEFEGLSDGIDGNKRYAFYVDWWSNEEKVKAVEVPAYYEFSGQSLNSIASAQISNIKTQIYAGKAVAPSVTVTLNGKKLKKGTDYTVSYVNNTKAGSTASVIVTGKGNYVGKVTKEFKIAAVPAKGKVYTAGNLKYKVTKSAYKNGTVSVYAPTKKTLTSVSVPATVKIGGYTFNVTAIGDKAFNGCTKLKKVTIGSKVTTIGKQAFNGCKALTSITISSKVLKTVGSSALKGISAKAVIKVPAAKLSAYQKLLKGKGQKSSVKITK